MDPAVKTEKRYPMSALDPSERVKNFCEVALGYDEETAEKEAARCLKCKNAPCRTGCPVGVDIPAFLALLAQGKVQAAYETVRAENALPAVCGRVCPQERQCEGKCVRGIKGEPIAIGRLERFVADRAELRCTAPRGEKEKVAVVGSGPAGLSCAGELVRLGYRVTVFEALHTPGGVLAYGIPEFRLPKRIVRREIEALRTQGVTFVCNAVVGKAVGVRELLERGYGAVFLGTGAGLPKFMDLPGENAMGVFSANEYLTRVGLMRAYERGAKTPVYPAKKVAVVGGGNVAMDAARSARRLGAEVCVVYRRSEEELPARREEFIHAQEEGITFRFLTNPVRILESEGKRVIGVECVRMERTEKDASGRRAVRPVAGSNFVVEADCVLMALGTSPNPIVAADTPDLVTGTRGEISADEEGATSLPGVFAGGDAVTGSATVILAMGAGKRAAHAIDRYLCSKRSS